MALTVCQLRDRSDLGLRRRPHRDLAVSLHRDHFLACPTDRLRSTSPP